MTAMSKVPTTTIRESRIVDDKLNNDCFTDCSRYRKSRRKTMQTEAATSRWSGLVHSRSGSLKSCQNLLVILMLWLNLSSIECFQKPQEASSNCIFPQAWEGSWFQSGIPSPIRIGGSTMSNRGDCIASDGDKFLMREKRCHRCVVIYEKHKNVLQYKESECDEVKEHLCPSALTSRSIIKTSEHDHTSDTRGVVANNTNHPNILAMKQGSSRVQSTSDHRSYDDNYSTGCRGRETLQNLCEQIPGDALLYSMFKIDAEPIKCPIRGPFTFTYNRGHGECKNPVSNIESCTEDSRMLLSFQACPDVSGTEHTVEELTCLAAWKDGNARYLVGLVSHNHATSNEERFRCFVYEKTNNNKYGSASRDADAEYKLAQSGDATCNGLESAEVGSRIMTLRKAPAVVRCDFPSWFKNIKHWHTLSGASTYIFHQNDGSLHIAKQNGYLEARVLCEQINKQTPVEMMAVVHHATGCKTGFVCAMFYRRNAHVTELQMGTPATRLEDACTINHFDINRLPFITLLAASNPDIESCPLIGSYSVRGLISPPSNFFAARRKRNHNSKHHHSHDPAMVNTRVNKGLEVHSPLSFRNEDDSLKSWKINDRSKSPRQRRSQPSNELDDEQDKSDDEVDDEEGLSSELSAHRDDTSSEGAFKDVSDDGSEVSSIDDDTDDVVKLVRNKRNNNNLRIEKGNDESNDSSRSRRDTIINCGSNVNSKARQLNIGCADESKIDVVPQCNNEGEEEYTCHATWRENLTTFIIATHASTKHGVCISFRQQLSTDSAQLFIGDSCYRENQGLDNISDHPITLANLTNVGRKCGEISTSGKLTASWLIHSIAGAVLTSLWMMERLTLLHSTL